MVYFMEILLKKWIWGYLHWTPPFDRGNDCINQGKYGEMTFETQFTISGILVIVKKRQAFAQMSFFF